MKGHTQARLAVGLVAGPFRSLVPLSVRWLLLPPLAVGTNAGNARRLLAWLTAPRSAVLHHQLSCSVVSDSLRLCGLRHASPPGPSPAPGRVILLELYKGRGASYEPSP